MSREQKLLDALEDARDDLARWRRTVWWWIIAAASSIVALIGGSLIGAWGTWHHVDTGGLVVAPIILGVIGVVIAAVGMPLWLADYEPRHPARALRNAERAYRDYLNGDM